MDGGVKAENSWPKKLEEYLKKKLPNGDSAHSQVNSIPLGKENHSS